MRANPREPRSSETENYTHRSHVRRNSEGSKTLFNDDVTRVEEEARLKVRKSTKLKPNLASVMTNQITNNIILVLVLAYTALIFFRIIYGDDISKQERQIIVSLEICFLSIFVIEIALRILVFKLNFLKSIWNLFDSCIVVVCMVLACIELSDEDLIDSSTAKLSALLRLFRLVVMFRKVNLVHKLKEKTSKVGILEITSISEKVIEILQSILSTEMATNDQVMTEELNWCIEMILQNKLNEINVLSSNIEQVNEVIHWVGKSINKPRASILSNYHSLIDPANIEIQASYEIPSHIKSYFDSLCSIEFDIFELKTLSGGSELKYLLLHLFDIEGIYSVLNISYDTLNNFLEAVQTRYLLNPYHNTTHAADVTQMMYYFLNYCNAKEVCNLSLSDIFICYFSASIHDIGHPAVSNIYLINSRSSLAIRYNDRSVLENFHISTAFKITQEEDKNIFKNLDLANLKRFREKVVKVVLATDSSKHFTELSKFKNRFGAGECKDENDRVQAMMMMLHAADISNPSRPWTLCEKWADLVLQEFFAQGDIEKAELLPVSPLCDRDTVSRPKSQVGFINFLTEPTFMALKMMLPLVEMNILYITQNKSKWEAIYASEEENNQQSNII